ncbi:TRAP transporter substrate-binding protein DctP [Neobacillus drentensis]|uniref:TRAP transporter substrate-binding protein DctP n=1 Tax=Neobacillus drentensis TaxID=220684 RepID=UPI002FFDD0BC
MKKTIFLLIAIILLASTALLGCSKESSTKTTTESKTTTKPQNSNEKITLKLASPAPETHVASRELLEPFAKKVSEYTNGQVTIQIYPNSQLGPAPDFYNMLNSGITDIAVCGPADPGHMPLSSSYTLPGVAPNSDVATKAYWKTLQNKNSQLYKTDFKNNRLIPIAAQVGPSSELVFANKEVSKVNDLKGLKLNGFKGGPELTIKALDATPVALEVPEIYISFDRGTVDGGIMGLTSVQPLKVDEVAKYFTTNLNIAPLVFNVAMSEKKFNSLPKNVQDAIIKAGNEVTNSIGAIVDKEVSDTKTQLTDKGMKPITFSNAELIEMKKKLDPVWKGWEKTYESKGSTAAIKEMEEAVTSESK